MRSSKTFPPHDHGRALDGGAPGWQFDGHHAAINNFIFGDQAMISPGSEPVEAKSGKHGGTIIMQEEQDRGLAFQRERPHECPRGGVYE